MNQHPEIPLFPLSFPHPENRQAIEDPNEKLIDNLALIADEKGTPDPKHPRVKRFDSRSIDVTLPPLFITVSLEAIINGKRIFSTMIVGKNQSLPKDWRVIPLTGGNHLIWDNGVSIQEAKEIADLILQKS